MSAVGGVTDILLVGDSEGGTEFDLNLVLNLSGAGRRILSAVSSYLLHSIGTVTDPGGSVTGNGTVMIQWDEAGLALLNAASGVLPALAISAHVSYPSPGSNAASDQLVVQREDVLST